MIVDELAFLTSSQVDLLAATAAMALCALAVMGWRWLCAMERGEWR